MCNMYSSAPHSQSVPSYLNSFLPISISLRMVCGDHVICMYISIRNYNHIQYYIFFLIFSNNHKNEIVTASTNLHNLFKIIIKNICFLHHILLCVVSNEACVTTLLFRMDFWRKEKVSKNT